MQKKEAGKLFVVTGPMFSGKTSRLIELMKRESLSGKRVLLFKSDIDTRYNTSEVAAHTGLRLNAVPLSIDKEGVEKLRKLAAEAEVIGVDEAQFWGVDTGLADALDDLANEGKKVYVSMLNKDNTGKAFSSAREILPIADEIQTLTAVCARCGGDATVVQRVRSGVAVFEPETFVAGEEGLQIHESRCRVCFERQKK